MKILLKDIKYLDFKSTNMIEASIGIENGRISFIGDIPSDFIYDEIIYGNRKVAMPGIFNAHTHIPMTLLRNYSDDQNLWSWLNDYIWPMEKKLKADDIYWGAMLGLAELIKFGTTCFVDMYFYIDKIGEALYESGMRGFISRGLIGNEDSDYKQLQETEDFLKKWDGEANGRIRGMVGPHAPYTCSSEYLLKAIELSEKYDTSIHIHLSESINEVEESIRKYGLTPTENMERIGLFKRNTLAAHCVQLTDRDIEILSENNVNILYNPISNMKLGNGFARIKDIKRSGINIALGTDGCASNNNMSLLEEIKILALINKGLEADPTIIPAIEALQIASANGIKAVGLEDELGSIEIGKKADLTILDLNKIQTTPINNEISSLVYSLQSDNIYSTIVDGKILMKNFEYYTLDIEKIMYNINRISERLSL
ncbi:MAG: amidohydrolase [Andreesenia angusta]|nr:amidohydrolase [Andreesenia angusta]